MALGRELLGFLAVILVAASYARAQEGEDRAKAIGAELREGLERCREHGWSGVVLVSVGERVLLEEAFGFADRERERPNTVETLFPIASLTKQFTAAGIYVLAKAGKLSLPTSLDACFEGLPPHCRKLQVQHLLDHRSGIDSKIRVPLGATREEAVRSYLEHAPQWEPGSQFEYCNPGYAVLAACIEMRSGQSFDAFCSTTWFEPFGMTHSGFVGDTKSEPAAVGYQGGTRVRLATEHPYGGPGWHYRGMGGIVTTARDLWMWMRRGPLQEIAKQSAGSFGYCFGWRQGRTASGSRKLSHGGTVAGFTADWRYVPEADQFWVVLSNSGDVPGWVIGDAIESVLQVGRSDSWPPEQVSWSKDQFEAVTGRYRSEDGAVFDVKPGGRGVALGAVNSKAARVLSRATVQPTYRLPAYLAVLDFVPIQERRALHYLWSQRTSPELQFVCGDDNCVSEFVLSIARTQLRATRQR